MKSRALKFSVAIVATMMVSLGAQAQSPQIANTGYEVTTLGTLGGSAGGGIGINNRGWVTGYSTLPGDANVQATLWVGDSKIPLGTLGGDNSGVFWPVKDERGLIVGISDTADMNPLHERWSCGFFLPTTFRICKGFAWQHSEMRALPPFAGGYNSYATGANNRGQIVGWAENAVHDTTCTAPQVLQFRATIWGEHDEMEELQPFGADATSAATAINDKGQVVGISGDCDRAAGRFSARHAVMWQDGKVTRLPDLGGDLWHTPTAINNRGQVAGFGNLPGAPTDPLLRRAFYWSAERGLVKIDPLPGDLVSFAWGINERGEVAGQSIGANGSRAFIWKDGVTVDVNEMVAAGSPTVEYANDINDRGEITGGGCVVCDGSDEVAVRLTPTPETIRRGSAAAVQASSTGIRLTPSIRKQLEKRMAIDEEGK